MGSKPGILSARAGKACTAISKTNSKPSETAAIKFLRLLQRSNNEMLPDVPFRLTSLNHKEMLLGGVLKGSNPKKALPHDSE